MDEVKDEKKDTHTNDQNSEENMKMEELLGPEVKVEEGKTVTVRVLEDTPDGFLVDLGLKSEGLLPKNEAERYGAEIEPGKEISVMVVSLRSASGHPIVSYRAVREQGAWEKIAAAEKTGVPVEGTIKGKVKGGFTVDIGVNAFLPLSQLELRFVKDTDRYIGKQFPFVITDVNRAQRNIVLSRRRLLEKELKEKKGATLAAIIEGQVVEGTVTGITSFGAFVDIGGIEGLLHIGDISWQHVRKVDEVLKTGQKVQVQILRIDREKEKVSLGMKQLSERPWNTAVGRYPVGSVVKGKITSLTDFGIFVEVEPGIEGLLHVSEVSWDENRPNVLKQFAVGQELEAKVIALDPAKEKLSLSLKRTKANPWEEAQQHYAPGTRVKGVVTNLAPFGAFVKLPEGIEGLVHVNDMSWSRKIRHPQDILKVGQEVETVVLDVNPQNEKISLSLKHVQEDPFRKYRSGAVVKGTVKRLVDFGAFVELEPGIEALVRLSEMAPRRVESAAEVLKEGQSIEAKVIKSDPSTRKIDISIKKLDLERERDLVRKYANRNERPTLGDMLTDANEEED